MSIYKHDDLGFDLEIRGNIFVNSQIYPEQKLIVVSFLEALKEIEHTSVPNPATESEVETVKNAVSTSVFDQIAQAQDQSRLNKFVTNNTDKTSSVLHEWTNGILQSYYDNGPDDYMVVSNSAALDIVKKKVFDTVTGIRDFDIRFENLATIDGFKSFAKRYGTNSVTDTRDLVKNNTDKKHQGWREYSVTYDTDTGYYDPDKQGLRIGYNSSNYDQTMNSHLIGDIMQSVIINELRKPEKKKKGIFYNKVVNQTSGDTTMASPNELVEFNKVMFSQNFGMKSALGRPWDKTPGIATYNSWDRSNRFVDVASLNPKKISLKRAAMALGLKIQESDTNREPTAPITTLDGIAELVAYNVNDIYATLKIFESGDYHNRYEQNKQLIKEFPYLVYEQTEAAQRGKSKKLIEYTIGKDNVREKRITTNDTSTKIVENTIAPYANTKIQDNETLNLNYPDAKIAAELDAAGKLPKIFNGKPMNVLDYVQYLIDKKKSGLDADIADKLQHEYDKIKSLYGAFIGKNFNDEIETVPLTEPSSMPVKDALVRYITPNGTYIDKHGRGLASYVKLSIGGTHGVEIRQANYDRDYKQYLKDKSAFDNALEYFNNSGDYTDEITMDNLAQTLSTFMPDEPFTHVKIKPLPNDPDHTFGDLMTKSASRKGLASGKNLRKIKAPDVFGTTGVNAEYAYTSSDPANHEDFDSYYPSLISMLAIFRNVDGDDVFTDDLYHPRLKLKKMSKDRSLPDDERKGYTLRQLSMKLLINAASGGGDASFSSKIKCNNKMLAMRIIGQLFCWYIGQSLSLENARVPSTNTDGLYTMSIEQSLNDSIVENCASDLLLKVDPEPLPLFVSKDANNRLELADWGLANARGGALTSWQGPSTQNQIAHPAIVDYVLAQYLAQKDDAVNQEFDATLAKQLFREFIGKRTKYNQTDTDTLRFLQFPIVSNPGTARFAFMAKLDNPNDYRLLNATNRAFMVKPEFSDETIKMSGLQSVRNPTVQKRAKDNHVKPEYLRDIIFRDPIADAVIKANASTKFYDNLLDQEYDPHAKIVAEKPRDLVIIKITDYPTDQPTLLYNEDLHDITHAEYQDLIRKIDFKQYLDLVQMKFETQWQNEINTTPSAA